MLVIFLRHGDAEKAGAGGDDASRALTRKGKQETRMVAEAMDALHVRPNLLLTSPLLRAVQTAEVAAARLKKAPAPIAVETLAPDHRWDEVRGDIQKRLKTPREAVVLLCGHQPDLGRHLAEVLTGSAAGGMELRKSGAICVQWAEGELGAGGRICLALEPESAKRLLKVMRK